MELNEFPKQGKEKRGLRQRREQRQILKGIIVENFPEIMVSIQSYSEIQPNPKQDI